MGKFNIYLIFLLLINSFFIALFGANFLNLINIKDFVFSTYLSLPLIIFWVIALFGFCLLHFIFRATTNQKDEVIFLVKTGIIAFILFLLQILNLEFFKFSGFDLEWLLTSWQIQIVLVSAIIGFTLAFYVKPLTGRKPNILIPSAIFVLTSVIYILMAIKNHNSFGTPARDVGIFDQAIWNLSNFLAPASTIRGFSNLWADHWHPILVLFAPLYWIWDDVKAILIAQALFIASGAYAVYYLSYRFLKQNFISAVLAICFVLYGGIQHALNFGFYPENMAPVFMLASFAALFWNKKWLYFVFFVLALLTKENIALYYVAFSVVLFFATKEKKIATATLIAAVSYFLVSFKLILPHFSGLNTYQYTNLYSDLGSSPGEILKTIVLHPLATLSKLFNPLIKMDTIVTILASVAFLPLLSIWGLLLVPNIFENFLSGRFLQWPFGYHYQAGISAFLILASVMALYRIQSRSNPFWKKRILTAAGITLIIVVLSLQKVYKLPIYNFLKDFQSNSLSTNHQALGILKQIPQEASVSAQDTLATHLSHRKEIYHYPDGLNSQYLILSQKFSSFPFSREEMDSRIRTLRTNQDWTIQAESDLIILFKHK